MTGWIIFGGVLLALFLLSMVRVGGFAEYGSGGLLAKLRVGPIFFTLYPIKRKQTKAKKKKKEKKKIAPEEEPPAKPGGTLAQLKQYLPLIPEAVGGAKHRIRIDKLCLDFAAAAPDAAAAAMAYGGANVAIGMILPVFEHNFKVKERRIRTTVDFEASIPKVYVHAALSMTIGQGIVLSVRLLILFLKLTLQGRAKQKAEKEAV